MYAEAAYERENFEMRIGPSRKGHLAQRHLEIGSDTFTLEGTPEIPIKSFPLSIHPRKVMSQSSQNGLTYCRLALFVMFFFVFFLNGIRLLLKQKSQTLLPRH